MPSSRINRAGWPVSGPHRDLLELLDQVHLDHGCKSLRTIGQAMHLSYTRVRDILCGGSLPVSEQQTRDLVLAMSAGSADPAEVASATDLFVGARRARDARGTEPSRLPHAEPEATPPPVSTVPPARLRWVIPTAVALAVATTAVLLWNGLERTGRAVEGTNQVLLSDGFDGDRLDPAKWALPSRPDLINVRDGALHMAVGASDTANGVQAVLRPAVQQPFHEISFVTAVETVTTAGPGGPAITLTEASGRTHKIAFGPSAGGPEIAVLVCSTTDCAQYDDFDPPAQFTPFTVGELVPIRVVQSGSRLQFYVRDRIVAQGPENSPPLVGFSIDLYGADEEAWDVLIDSVTVRS